MRGHFSQDDIQFLSTSGIQNNSPFSNYNATGDKTSTQVSTADSALEGYWRFSGGASGELDLSLSNNNLVPLAKQAVEDGTLTTLLREAADNLRFLPGPLENSDLGVKSSGITYAADEPPIADAISPYVASGTVFQSPNADFSIGFLYCKREDVPNNQVRTVLSYGTIPSTNTNTTRDANYGWAIVMDTAENVFMNMALNEAGSPGNMYLANIGNVASSGQITAGAFRANKNNGPGSSYEGFKEGNFSSSHPDAWNHYCWTFDASAGTLSCYFNGELVDKTINPDLVNGRFTVQNPLDPSARLISMLMYQQSPWDWGDTDFADFDCYLTDLCYFSKTLTEPEVRYIARNGIDAAVGTPTSGVIGGFVHGQDTASGVIGGYQQGLDTASGVVGGYMPGGLIASGIIGGYVSGVVFGTGTIGGFVRGLDSVSGILGGYVQGLDIGSGLVAGYIRGQEVGSGVLGGLLLGGTVGSGILGGLINASALGSGYIGGFIIGGLEGRLEFDAGYTVEVRSSKDFDAQLEVAKAATADFDAKVVIFQDEIPPLVDIIIPDATVSGLAPPFNQYFIAKASGQQGKTINSTRWNFGDLTPSVSVSESGAGCYPVQHQFTGSGFYIVKFEAIDSDGLHSSATRIVNAASGIDPVTISLSGVPRSGNAGLVVDFNTSVDILPDGVSVITSLLDFDDGQKTLSFSPTHVYTEPGTYKPLWMIRDSRGIIWTDSLDSGNDYWDRGF